MGCTQGSLDNSQYISFLFGTIQHHLLMMSGLKSSVLLPLYIYPLPKAWDPLYTAIESHPTLDFTIIINPNSGPGKTGLPDEDYSREIARLSKYPNVYMVGYVRVNWCKRDLEKVFMDAADARVKNSDGLGGFRLTIHNPGTVPDTEYANPGPDLTTVFETEYKHFKDREVQQRLTNLLRYDRDRCSYMVLSVPKEEVPELVKELKRRAKYVFVSESKRGWYEKFGEGWPRFI